MTLSLRPWGCLPDEHTHHRQFWRWHNNPAKQSRFVGVTTARHRWKAHLIRKTAGIACSLGCFGDQSTAARAYDLAALAIYGDEALTNFDKEDYRALLGPMVVVLLKRGLANDSMRVRKAARRALGWLANSVASHQQKG